MPSLVTKLISTFLSAVAGLLVLSGPATAIAKPIAHTVTIENMQFSPTEITIAKGDTIVWNNHDLVPHTVTAENNQFDSKSIEPGESWRLTLKKSGSVHYKCLFHPNMKASLNAK